MLPPLNGVQEMEWQDKARETQYRVSAFASKLGMSPRQLQHAFRKFGITPIAWIKQLGHADVTRHLREGCRPNEVCNIIGLTHPHFSRQFKKFARRPMWQLQARI
jgi:AraC-like DNA-binding protein